MADNWLETDSETEGVLALEMTVEQLSKALDDPYRWKWAIIALHNSLQAFLVHATSGSDKLGAATESYRRRWYEAYERGEFTEAKERLATVGELMQRARKLKGYVYTRSLPPNEEQDRAAARLGNWRDTFIHFKPMGLTIEISGFPDICRPCIDVIEFLAFESGHVWVSRDELAERTRRSIDSAREHLDRIAAVYHS